MQNRKRRARPIACGIAIFVKKTLSEPISRVLFVDEPKPVDATIISLGRRLLAASSSLPGSRTDRTDPPAAGALRRHTASPPCLALLLVGFAEPIGHPKGR